MKLNEQNGCIYCGKPLSKWENTRSYCWNCSELTTSEAFNEEDDHSGAALLLSEKENITLNESQA